MFANNTGHAVACATTPACPGGSCKSKDRLITIAELARILNVSKSTIERMIRTNPDFPQPRKMPGDRLIRFLESEVNAFIASLPRVQYDDHAFDASELGRGE